MPEGPTLHRAARELRRRVVGETVRAASPQGRFATEARRIDRRVLRDAEPYGKHLFLVWDDARIVHVHLGLAGKLLWLGPDPSLPRPQVRLRLRSPRGGVDLIGPARCRLVTRADRDAVVARLGPDPLRPDGDVAEFRDRVARSARPIGALLMDQSVIAGIGNVIRAEALFLTGIHPLRPGRTLTATDVDALWTAAGELMRNAVRRGRILSLPLPAGVSQHAGRFVYRQETCRRCGSPVQRTALAGRTSYACARCQIETPRP